jgi:hypothetical protein
MNTAWLGVPITCQPGASCFENKPLKGNTTTLRLCRSTSPHFFRDVARLEQADLHRLAVEQCPAGYVHWRIFPTPTAPPKLGFVLRRIKPELSRDFAMVAIGPSAKLFAPAKKRLVIGVMQTRFADVELLTF